MKTVALVGHCGPDCSLLKRAVLRAEPEARVELVNDEFEFQQELEHGSVLLINRVLAGDFRATSGVELIRDAVEKRTGVVVMLVSDQEDSQREAVQAGARPGFGKSRVYADETAAILKAAMADSVAAMEHGLE